MKHASISNSFKANHWAVGLTVRLTIAITLSIFLPPETWDRFLRLAPFAKVSYTSSLNFSPVQTMPSPEKTGTPEGLDALRHLRSSMISGSASTIRPRMRSSI